jgi:hypothetical protein
LGRELTDRPLRQSAWKYGEKLPIVILKEPSATEESCPEIRPIGIRGGAGIRVRSFGRLGSLRMTGEFAFFAE